MFFLRVSRYRDADRVESAATCRPGVRRRFVSSKTFTFARTQIARTRQPRDDALSCSPHFSSLTPYRDDASSCMKSRSRATRVNPCYIIHTVTVHFTCSRGVSGSTFSFKLSILRDALTCFILYSAELDDIEILNTKDKLNVENG